MTGARAREVSPEASIAEWDGQSDRAEERAAPHIVRIWGRVERPEANVGSAADRQGEAIANRELDGSPDDSTDVERLTVIILRGVTVVRIRGHAIREG